MDTLKLINQFSREKSFVTRGLPLTKKLWRDGYNKAIQDMIIWLEGHNDDK